MRKCKCKYYVGKVPYTNIGKFHCWGSNFVELDTGAGNYTVAIVELLDGTIVECYPKDIQFISDVKEVLRKAKIGEFIKIVAPFEGVNCSYGDIHKVIGHSDSGRYEEIPSHILVAQQEYVVLEGYESED